jgi:hypothetical protein
MSTGIGSFVLLDTLQWFSVGTVLVETGGRTVFFVFMPLLSCGDVRLAYRESL